MADAPVHRFGDCRELFFRNHNSVLHLEVDFTFVVTQKTSEELRKEISALRAEAAQTYVTIVAHKLIKETIDRRSDHMESAIDRLSATVDRMSDKQDKAIGELVSTLSARFAQT